MANLLDFLNAKIKPYLKIITIIFVIIIFLGASYYFYTQFYLKNYVTNKEFKDVANNNQRNGEIELYFVSVDWCPYCNKAKPEWDTFSKEYNNTFINTTRITCISVNEDANKDLFNNVVNKYNIDKYPTVFIILDGKRYDFDSSVSYYSLQQFVTTVAENRPANA